MINLNLISLEQKRELKIKRIYIIIKKLIIIFLFFSVILAVLLIISRYILESKLTKIINENISSIEISQKTNQRIGAINKKVNQVETIQTNFKQWSTFLTHLSVITPPSIAYNFFNIYYQTASLEIKGTAKTRQALLDFETNLKSSSVLSNVDLPLHYLLAQTNNDFVIQANINLDQVANGY